MGKPKHEEPEEHGESAPLWIISFADLVTLLMSFFVILAAGKPQDSGSDPKFREVVEALKAAFNNVPAAAVKVEDPHADFEALVKRLMALAKLGNKVPGQSETKDKGIHGKSFRVRRMRDGMQIVVGGPVCFEPFSAKPTPEGELQLQQIVDIVKGHRNIIEIRGHVGEEPLPTDWTYQDAMKLSYARAEFVSEVLLKNGTDSRAIRLVAAGPSEPVARGVYDPGERGQNRRVEIIVRETLIDDYVGQAPASTSPDTQPAGPTRPAGEPATLNTHR